MTMQTHAQQAPASASFASASVSERGTAPTSCVGEPLTEEGREEAIKRADALWKKKYADFAKSGLFADLGDAHRALLLKHQLEAGRDEEGRPA